MNLAQLEHAQKRMQQKWYDLAMAEQRGAPEAVLERMYSSYVLAMEEYNRYSAEHQCQQQLQVDVLSVKQKKSARLSSSSIDGEQTKLAS